MVSSRKVMRDVFVPYADGHFDLSIEFEEENSYTVE
jgi:hypothetical protein